MTQNGSSTPGTSRVLTALVVITIVLVALWALGGGFDQIGAPTADNAVVSG